MTEQKVTIHMHEIYEGIPYISYSEFFKLYPITQDILLGEGTSGKIFESDKYAIKRFDKLEPFIRELNMYASLSHPCILKPLYWTYNIQTANEIEGYFLMEKGISITQAYKNNKITIEQIISDTLSAIEFMNYQGFAHCDIKHSNMIYSQGKAKIIDMDLSRKATLSDDGFFYITEVAYTEGFRDPEYIFVQWNNISCELYALAMSYYVIMSEGKLPEVGNLYHFKSGIEHVDWLLNEILVTQDLRPSIQHILNTAPKNLIVRRHEGISHTVLFRENPNCGNIEKELFEWMINIGTKAYFDSKILFLALGLAHRSFYAIIDHDDETIQLFGKTCIDLVTYASKIFPEGLNVNKTMAFNILKATNFIITTQTYWDAAKSKEDLVLLLEDTVNCYYDPSFVRELGISGNKDITVGELRKIYNTKQRNLDMKRRTPKVEKNKLQPTILNTKLTQEQFKIILDDHKYDIYTEMAMILHNRYILSDIDEELALEIYMELTDMQKYSYEVLDIICNFNWRNYDINRLSHIPGGHPFIATQSDLDANEEEREEEREYEEDILLEIEKMHMEIDRLQIENERLRTITEK